MKTIFLLGSKVDMEHAESISGPLKDEWGIECEVFVGSAHKVPKKVAALIERYNEEQDVVYVTIAGRSNALSGVVAANAVHPVIGCPPHKTKEDFMVNINSTLMMPSETPVMTVCDPKNCVLSVVKIFALKDEGLRGRVVERITNVKDSFDL
jgi:5-(carboxyamino)imidazole ribonucleotide mutase